MARAIAERIRRQPALFEIATQNLVRWKRIQNPWPHALREWEEIIDRHSMEEVLAILTEDTEEGHRLRQSDPFCGILSEAERLDLLEKYEALGA